MFLNNFDPSEFIADDNFKYPTAEHYYQAHKFTSNVLPEEFTAYYKEVREQDSPGKAKKLARKYQANPNFNNEDWEGRKDEVMKKGLTFKFSQNKDLLEKLVNTEKATLIE